MWVRADSVEYLGLKPLWDLCNKSKLFKYAENGLSIHFSISFDIVGRIDMGP